MRMCTHARTPTSGPTLQILMGRHADLGPNGPLLSQPGPEAAPVSGTRPPAGHPDPHPGRGHGGRGPGDRGADAGRPPELVCQMHSAAHCSSPALRDGLCPVSSPHVPGGPPRWRRKASGVRAGRATEWMSSAHCTGRKTDAQRGRAEPKATCPARGSILTVGAGKLHRRPDFQGANLRAGTLGSQSSHMPGLGSKELPVSLSPAGCWSWRRGRWQRAAARPSCWPRRGCFTGWHRSQAWSEPPPAVPTWNDVLCPGDTSALGSLVAPQC